MKILFQLSNLSRQDQDFLSRILGTVADGWHDWMGPPPDSDVFAPYFAAHPPHYHELAIKSFSSSVAYSNAVPSQLTVVDDADKVDPLSDTYTVREAYDYLSQPLRILVENEISDGHFYLRYLQVVDPDLAEHFVGARPPIIFDQGGGNSEIARLVDTRVQRAMANGVRPRIVVVADSDARYPGHIAADTRRLIEACEKHGVPVHVTRKRSLESYLPDEIFASLANRFVDMGPAVRFVLSLNSQQRDHYPIKHGLPDPLSDGERTLYGELSIPIDKMRVARIEEHFRNSWGEAITRTHLHDRDCIAEIESISTFLRKRL